MYATARQLADLARQRQQDLLSQAAEVRLIRRDRRSLSVSTPTSRSVHRRLASGLRTLAAWIDSRARGGTPQPQLEAA